MKKILVLLLAFTVIGMAIPAMADEIEIEDFGVGVGADLNLDNHIDQILTTGSQYNTNEGDVMAITEAASIASAANQIGAFSSVSNDGGSVGDSQAEVGGDVEDNDFNDATAYSDDVDTYNEVYFDQYNDIYQDAYADVYNDQYVDNYVTVDVDQDI